MIGWIRPWWESSHNHDTGNHHLHVTVISSLPSVPSTTRTETRYLKRMSEEADDGGKGYCRPPCTMEDKV